MVHLVKIRINPISIIFKNTRFLLPLLCRFWKSWSLPTDAATRIKITPFKDKDFILLWDGYISQYSD